MKFGARVGLVVATLSISIGWAYRAVALVLTAGTSGYGEFPWVRNGLLVGVTLFEARIVAKFLRHKTETTFARRVFIVAAASPLVSAIIVFGVRGAWNVVTSPIAALYVLGLMTLAYWGATALGNRKPQVKRRVD